jgi:peptide-methionine (S)-S-oxide reductase
VTKQDKGWWMNPLPFADNSFLVHLIIQAKEKAKRKFLKAKDSIMGQVNGRLRDVQIAAPAKPSPMKLSNTLALGAGCYWGTEKYVRKNFQQNFPHAIKSCSVGFMSPQKPEPKYRNPTYEQVCSGASGHIEVLYVELNDPEKHFEELIRFFFQFHDPTTKNRQGNDRGFQYASWIFCSDEAQSAIATKVRNELQAAIKQRAVVCFENKTISTNITTLTEFTKAQKAHQEYLANNPNGYCNHRLRLKEWITSKPPQDEEN